MKIFFFKFEVDLLYIIPTKIKSISSSFVMYGNHKRNQFECMFKLKYLLLTKYMAHRKTIDLGVELIFVSALFG